MEKKGFFRKFGKIGGTAIIILSILIVGVLAYGLFVPARPSAAAIEPGSPAEGEREKERVKIIEIEREISSETIQDGLREMGRLITGEYYFTEVITVSSAKHLFNTGIKLPFTQSSSIFSYDGTVTAGINFAAISVTKEPEKDLITVILPRAEIFSVTVDNESFVLYEERTGIGNPFSVADYNDALIQLKKNAGEKAVEKGLLKRADDTAAELISNFVRGIMGENDYTLTIDYAG